MYRHLAMCSKVGLNDQIDIPNRTCQIMDMNRPCIIIKVAPIVSEDAKLHEDHWDYHPFVQGFILTHLYTSKIFRISGEVKLPLSHKYMNKSSSTGAKNINMYELKYPELYL